MRWVIGPLLICAASLKAIEVFTGAPAALTNPLGRFLAPIQITTEIVIGVLALSGFYWRQLRWLVLLLFCGFALYSLYLAMNGEVSCGCFGSVKVHPWWTFALDMAVVIGLLLSIAVEVWQIAPRSILSQQAARATTLVALLLGAVAVLSWGLVLVLAGSTDDVVVLEPESWIGKKLPIADVIAADLSQGDWILLLHRHDCPKCEKAAAQYEQLADARKVALIEIPPYGSQRMSQGPALHARMPDDREWFVQTPVEIRLVDGIVVDASTDLPALKIGADL